MVDVTKIKCFEQVSKVIGVERAKTELNKVLADNTLCVFGYNSLAGAFSWHRSPQGHHFWKSICCGTNPISSADNV